MKEEHEQATLRQYFDLWQYQRLLEESQRASEICETPRRVLSVSFIGKQATNSCDCKRSTLSLHSVATMNTTAPLSVGTRIEGRDSENSSTPLRLRELYPWKSFHGLVEASYFYPQKENSMNNTGSTMLVFLTGLGIGAGLAVLFAPQSGEETREWMADTAERKFKVLRRVGRRSFRQLQDAVAEGEEKVTGVLRNGRKALGSVAAKLD
jgi:gas vesicle protein